MQWESLGSFLSMGGYGFYVWGSYAVCVAVIVAEIVALRHRRGAAIADVKRAGPAMGRAS